LEAKNYHEKLVKELNDHKQKMENKFDTIHAIISKISQCMTEEGPSNLEEKLEEMKRHHVKIQHAIPS
jgi:polyhydroxyalkanoate synthesis regulator phasin